MTRTNLLARSVAVLLIAIPVAAAAQDAFTNRSVNVRAGPDMSYPVVAVLGAGAPVQVEGCLDDWSWCDVAFYDNRGWIFAPYLTYVYQGARVPFYTYAPSFGIPIITFSIGSYWDRWYRGRPWYGRRDYWERRGPPPHVRPPGPPPQASPPPATRAVPFSRSGPDRERSAPPRTGVAPSSEGRRASVPAPTPSTGVRQQVPAVVPSAGGPPVQVAPIPQGGGGAQRVERHESKGGEKRGPEGSGPEEKHR